MRVVDFFLILVFSVILNTPEVVDPIPDQRVPYFTYYDYTILKGTFRSTNEFSVSVTSKPSWLSSEYGIDLMGEVDTSHAGKIAVSGDYAYVADGIAGLRVINVANPLNPNIVNTLELDPYNAYDVMVYDGFLYVADYHTYVDGGLKIFDISTPTSPSLHGHFTDCVAPVGVFLQDSYAYLADSTEGLKIVNISTPSSPKLIGSLDTNDARSVFVSGQYAYIADAGAGLKVVDVSNPSSPFLAASMDTEYAVSVFHSDNITYLCDHGGGLKIIDTTNPIGPVLLHNFDNEGESISLDVYVVGNTAYIADYNGVEVLDITDPSNPTLLASQPVDDKGLGISVEENYVYLCDSYAGLKIYSVGNTILSGTCTKGGLNFVELTATDDDESSVTETFTIECICPSGWSGEDCRSRCLYPSDCENGGSVSESDCLECECVGAFQGVKCTDCMTDGNFDPFDCVTCSGGWEGQNCTECDHLTCENGGVHDEECLACECVDNFGLYDCSGCAGGWAGEQCNICNISCQNGGTWNDECTSCTCIGNFIGSDCSQCSGGWDGEDCSTCDLICENGGENDDECLSCECFGRFGGSDCSQCIGGWTGDDCSFCSKNCQNGGSNDEDCTLCTCLQNFIGDDCSICLGGWAGLSCSTCSLCQNGGLFNRNCTSCHCVGNYGGFDCSVYCENGWDGDVCDDEEMTTAVDDDSSGEDSNNYIVKTTTSVGAIVGSLVASFFVFFCVFAAGFCLIFVCVVVCFSVVVFLLWMRMRKTDVDKKIEPVRNRLNDVQKVMMEVVKEVAEETSKGIIEEKLGTDCYSDAEKIRMEELTRKFEKRIEENRNRLVREVEGLRKITQHQHEKMLEREAEERRRREEKRSRQEILEQQRRITHSRPPVQPSKYGENESSKPEDDVIIRPGNPQNQPKMIIPSCPPVQSDSRVDDSSSSSSDSEDSARYRSTDPFLFQNSPYVQKLRSSRTRNNGDIFDL